MIKQAHTPARTYPHSLSYKVWVPQSGFVSRPSVSGSVRDNELKLRMIFNYKIKAKLIYHSEFGNRVQTPTTVEIRRVFYLLNNLWELFYMET